MSDLQVQWLDGDGPGDRGGEPEEGTTGDGSSGADRAAGSATAPRAARLLLSAPRRRNALTPETVEDLMTFLEQNEDATAVLGSTSPDIFSAGADLSVDDRTRALLSDRLYACYELMVRRPGVVLAVVEGAAVGGGAQLTAAADVRVASPTARWRWVGPGHGLAVGAWILPELLGRARALDLALTGRWLDAEEALAAGFVTTVDADPWARAEEIRGHLGTADAAALGRVKQIANHPGLLERLAVERTGNRETWQGSAPSAREAAREGRRRHP